METGVKGFGSTICTDIPYKSNFVFGLLLLAGK
jgi:hypothetical protein